MEDKAVQNSFSSSKVRPFYIFAVIFALAAAGGLLYYQTSLAPSKTTPTSKPKAIEKPLAKIGIPTPILGIYPNTQPEAFTIAFNANIFEGLTVWRDGKVAPGLAISWSTPDKNTWQLKLRTGVMFHNGNKFTAEDVKYSIEQAQANKWPIVGQVANIESVTLVDANTVEIRTVEPDPILLPKLTFAFVISKAQAENEGTDSLVGTGPYKISKFEKEEYSLEANPNYWGGQPLVKKVIYKLIPPDKTAQALLEGQIDIASLSSSADNTKLEQKGFKIKGYNLPVVFHLTFDFKRDKTPYVDAAKNPFKNKKVRQALLYGINIDELIKNAVLDGVPATQFVTSEIFGFNQDIKRPEYNLDKAKELLDSAGYPNGFSVTIDVPAPFQTDKELVRQLKRLGLKVEARVLQSEKDLAKVSSGDYSLLASAWQAETLDFGDVLVGVLHTQTKAKGQANVGGYSNQELDKLADDASSTFDPKSRLALLKKAAEVAMEDVAWVPLYSTKNFAAVKPGFDWTPHNFGLVYAYEVTGR